MAPIRKPRPVAAWRRWRRLSGSRSFLWQSYRDAVDQVVDTFDKLLTRAHTQAQNELDEQLCRQRQTIQLSLTAGN